MTERTAPAATQGPSPVPFVPGLADVPAARSSICFIDGDQGILEYRGLSIESLAEHSTFEETSYLLLWGKLPNRTELEKWSKDLSTNRDPLEVHPAEVGTPGVIGDLVPRALQVEAAVRAEVSLDVKAVLALEKRPNELGRFPEDLWGQPRDLQHFKPHAHR